MKAALVKARQSLRRDYQQAMREHLKKADESSLEAAYELSRRALEEGMGVVEMAALFDDALSQFLQDARTPAECSRTAKVLATSLLKVSRPLR